MVYYVMIVTQIIKFIELFIEFSLNEYINSKLESNYSIFNDIFLIVKVLILIFYIILISCTFLYLFSHRGLKFLRNVSLSYKNLFSAFIYIHLIVYISNILFIKIDIIFYSFSFPFSSVFLNF